MDQEKMSWSEMMEMNRERKFEKMRAPALIAIVIALHAMAVGAIMFMQGCGTTAKTASVEPPPVPVMPPKPEAKTPPVLTPKPVFHPPAPIEPAPSMTEPMASKTYVVQNGDWYTVVKN